MAVTNNTICLLSKSAKNQLFFNVQDWCKSIKSSLATYIKNNTDNTIITTESESILNSKL